MSTVHLVYPHGPSISCPDAIGRNLGARLRTRYDVILYDWDRPGVITPGNDDILLGHPHPAPWTIFRRSSTRPGWKKIVVMMPYTHGDIRHMAWAEKTIARCDAFLAITGNYWYASAAESALAHWVPRMRHLDLAVDRADFPFLKPRFNPPGARKFVYIGHDYWFKNMEYLEEIGRVAPDVAPAWIGWSPRNVELRSLGRQDFSTKSAQELVAEHDFLITVGSSDPNPTTILEAIAWGLIPVCTRESGYVGYPGIVNVPLGDVARTVDLLRELQFMSEERLVDMQQTNLDMLNAHFNWDRFTAVVIDAIEDPRSEITPADRWAHGLRLRWASVTSPHYWMRPRQLWRALRTILGR